MAVELGALAALGAIALGVATGHPEIAILSPFLEEGMRGAFVAPATQRLQKEVAEAKVEQDEAAQAARIVESVEALIGQALVQIVRVQHRTKDEIIDALGGVREDLADFRAEVQRGLDDEGVRVDVQRVENGATGVRISPGARGRVFIHEMTVSGSGSMGIDLRGR